MDCGQAIRLLWAGEESSDELASHVRTCEPCSTELRRSGQLSAALAGLADELAVPAPELYPALIASIPRSRFEWAREAITHPKFWRGAAVGAAAATVAAFGVVVARRLVRPDLAT